MVVKKSGSGWAVKHCKGKKGTIARHKTKKKAQAQHRAIQASKRRKKS
jgi:hypothetical protein